MNDLMCVVKDQKIIVYILRVKDVFYVIRQFIMLILLKLYNIILYINHLITLKIKFIVDTLN